MNAPDQTPAPPEIRRRLVELITRRGSSQKTLAKSLGWHTGTLSRKLQSGKASRGLFPAEVADVLEQLGLAEEAARIRTHLAGTDAATSALLLEIVPSFTTTP